MDLSEILSKTKGRSEKIKIIRKPPSIASIDRPYSPADISETNKNSSSIQTKTDNKPATNWQQTDNRSDNKLAANRQQIDNKEIILKETGNKPTTDLTTNWQQTDNKLATKTTFSMLVGLQRACLLFIYQSCKTNRSKVTESLSLEHIAKNLKTTTGAVKTTLQRLEEKCCLLRVSFKNGRGGWSIYELPENIFTEMLRQETDNKLATNWQQTDNKLGSELATSPSSSSSYININTTTTGASENLKDEWNIIDMEPIKEIGFTTAHLMQIAQQGKLSAEIVQDSIHAFAFDLKHNKKEGAIKGSPLNYLMGILRNGKPYAPAGNYESPQDREMRIYLERKQKIAAARAAREEELIKLAFAEWERNETEENKQALLPEDIRVSRITGLKQVSLRSYFIKEIWPKKRKELEKEIFDIK